MDSEDRDGDVEGLQQAVKKVGPTHTGGARTPNHKHKQEADLTTSGFIQTGDGWASTSSWTRPRCVRGGRWSLCADLAHAGWRGKQQVSSGWFGVNVQLGSTSFSPPEVPESTVGPDLLQPLQIFSQLVVQTVGQNLEAQTDLSVLRMEPVNSHQHGRCSTRSSRPKRFREPVLSELNALEVNRPVGQVPPSRHQHLERDQTSGPEGPPAEDGRGQQTRPTGGREREEHLAWPLL